MPAFMTLEEYAKGDGVSPLTKATAEIFADTSDVLRALPFDTVTGGAYRYQLENTLPGIAFRGVNESFTRDTSVENPQVESLFTAGGEAEIDNFLLRVHGEARRGREENRKMKAMARAVTDVIMTGDNTTEPREFDGLQRRLTGTQKIANSGASGGGALSLAKLDEAIAQVVEPTHIIMPRKFRDVYFTGLMRNQTLMGNVQLSKDDLGRKVMSYNGLPMLVGYEVGPDQNLLDFNEVGSGGGGAVTCSFYIVSFKPGHVFGIEGSAMITKDLGELQTKPAKATRVEWDVGMVIEHPWAAARLTSITDAAIVA